MHHYTVAQEKSRLVLTKKTGDMKLFLNDLDDLHQWDFMRNQQMVKEIEGLRVLLTTTNQRLESWKVRALMAEAQFLEATAKSGNNGGGAENVSDVRYASLKRYLAKRFHPDYAPGQGIEKVVRNEIFKEIWNEIDRLDQGASATRAARRRDQLRRPDRAIRRSARPCNDADKDQCQASSPERSRTPPGPPPRAGGRLARSTCVSAVSSTCWSEQASVA
jgi:hypothetical protein